MPIPITILSGFLGAGKTTLLNHILNGNHGLRVAVLVNDFGDINIDAQLVVGKQEQMVNLSNGCICCTIRDDLRQATVDLLQQTPPPEYIIIETSGVSEPLEVARTFASAPLNAHVVVDSILTVIDAEQFSGLKGENSILAMDQISVADIVILNKVDLVSAEELGKVRQEWIYEVSPKARIIETTYSHVPLELIVGVGSYDPERLTQRSIHDVHVHRADAEADHHHHDHSMIFETWSWQSDQPLSLKALRNALDTLPLDIYRAKGFVYLADMPEQRHLIQVVGKRVGLAPHTAWDGESPYSQIVLIGAHGGVDAAELQVRFDSCLAQNQSSTLDKVSNVLTSWLRRG